MTFSPFGSSLISFIGVSESRSFASLGRFVPRNCTLSVAVVSGVVSFISVYDLLLPAYESARASVHQLSILQLHQIH